MLYYGPGEQKNVDRCKKTVELLLLIVNNLPESRSAHSQISPNLKP